MAGTQPTFFKNGAEMRKWLQKNHDKQTELHVGYYKAGSSKKGITRAESVDEALCFGWIDGVLHSIDEESYTVRFTPRRKNSIWSAVNVKRIKELMKEGLVHQRGIEEYEQRKEHRMNLYVNEQKEVKLGKEYEAIFKKNKAAWAYFRQLTPGYRKASIWWVISAKQEATRLRRLDTLIEDSANNRKIKQLNLGAKK
jgi:uncharacterized protein YdeI (YjbR/CyaY-like superfamily)